MNTQSLWKTCKVCQNSIAKNAKSCPNCGARQPASGKMKWIVLGGLGLLAIGLLNKPEVDKEAGQSSTASSAGGTITAKSEPPEIKLPAEQAAFIDAVATHRALLEGAKNELQEAMIRDRRRDAIVTALPNVSVERWSGTIRRLETNSEGKAVLSVMIAKDIDLQTWNNALSDIGANTLIEKDDPLYDKLLTASVGAQVLFSGSFFRSSKDGVQENSFTTTGSIRAPEFLFKFADVEIVN